MNTQAPILQNFVNLSLGHTEAPEEPNKHDTIRNAEVAQTGFDQCPPEKTKLVFTQDRQIGVLQPPKGQVRGAAFASEESSSPPEDFVLVNFVSLKEPCLTEVIQLVERGLWSSAAAALETAKASTEYTAQKLPEAVCVDAMHFCLNKTLELAANGYWSTTADAWAITKAFAEVAKDGLPDADAIEGMRICLNKTLELAAE